MPERIVVELKTPNSVKADQVKSCFAQELAKQNQELAIDSMEEVEAVGMTTPELIISVVVSVTSSAAVHVFRDHIDAAAKSVGYVLKVDVRTLFKGQQKSIEDDDPTE